MPSFKFNKDFFLKNTGIKQTVLKNTFWLALAEVIVQLLKLVLIVYTARILGAEDYGKFSFALSFVVLFVIFAELGLPDIITREFSKNKDGENEYSSIVSLKIFVSFVVFLFIYAASFFITKETSIRESIWLLAVFIIITSFLNIFYAFFRARQKMEYEAAFKIAQYVILSVVSLVALFVIPSIKSLSFAYAFANGVMVVMIVVFFHFFIRRIRLAYDLRIWKKFINFSWPLILGFSIAWVYVPVSSVILGYFGYHTENGWYNAAYKIIGAVALSAILISRSLFPVLSKVSAESKEIIQKVWNYQKEVMIVFAFPFMVGGVVLAPKIIDFFYDASYAPSAPVFAWLAVVFAIDLLYYPYACALIIFGYEKINFILMLIGLIINIVLNILLIPQYGLGGVVASNVISLAIIFLLSVTMAMRHTTLSPFNKRLAKTMLLVVISSAMMFFIISFPAIYHLPLVASVMIGSVAYFGVFASIHYFLKHYAHG